MATWFGKIYDYFSPLYDRSIFALTKDQLISMTGGPFAYVFFLILIFGTMGFKEKKNWIMWLLIPPLLFFGSGDIKHIYLPIILGLIAFGLAKILRILYLRVFQKSSSYKSQI